MTTEGEAECENVSIAERRQEDEKEGGRLGLRVTLHCCLSVYRLPGGGLKIKDDTGNI